jgi:hypothetical protein
MFKISDRKMVHQAIIKLIKIATIFFLLSALPFELCVASDVLFVSNSKESSFVLKQLGLVSVFYGVNLKQLFLENPNGSSKLEKALKDPDLGAVIMEASVLHHINPDEILRNMKVPCLIVNVTPNIDSNILKRWSKGAVIGCTNADDNFSKGFYRASDLKDITFELAGQTFPFSDKTNGKRKYFNLDKDKRYQVLLEVSNNKKEDYLPIFIRTTFSGKQVFFQSGAESGGLFENSSELSIETFFEIAPIMIFIRYSLGDKCWHSNAYYANFTIDDPFLTETYGNLNYKDLLLEMQKLNFHTTIAFIPWNFDRSEKEVVRLFQENPDRYSICIHGNNHDYKEFSSETSLVRQEANIKQAISRMEKFTSLTGLPYDKVMVFPRGIFSVGALRILKKYNFLSTVNGNNLPPGSNKQKDTIDALRSYSIECENFPSLKRYSVINFNGNISINLFLNGNILLYGHQELFKNGTQKLKAIVVTVNNIKPDIEWRSIGYISQRLYLQKFRNKGECDIKVFSSNFVLENKYNRRFKYYVSKEESFHPEIKSLTIDGRPHDYSRDEKYLYFEINVPPKASKHVVIEYENDLNIKSIDTSKNGIYISLLRRISDYRDMVMSRNKIGILIIDIYYKSGNYALVLIVSTVLLLCVITSTIIAYKYRSGRNKKK